MIIRLVLLSSLLFGSAATMADEDYSWCQGFIVKALGEFPTEGLSRTNMWLDWSEIVSQTIGEKTLDPAQYQAGRDHYTQLQANSNFQAIVDASEEQCAVGRSPLWLWW